MRSFTIIASLLTTFSVLSTGILAVPTPADDGLAESVNNTAAPLDANLKDRVPFPFDPANSEPLERIFDAIEHLPDDLLAKDDGGKALHDWILKHGGAGLTVDLSKRDEEGLVERQSLASILRCTWEIGVLIVENRVPLLKLRRIKYLISKLKGAKAVAKLLLKSKSWQDVKNRGGPYLYELARILGGWQGVAEHCLPFLG